MIIKKEGIIEFGKWLTGHDKETVEKLFDDFNNYKERDESVSVEPLFAPKIADVSKHDEITATILEGVFITYTEKEYGYTRGGLPQKCIKKMMEILIKRGYEPQIKTWNVLKNGKNC